MNVGENIKRNRTAKSLSQKEVTIISKLDTAQYSRIENGKTDPSVNTLEKIAHALGVTLADLFSTNTNTLLNNEASLDKSVLEKVALVESLSDEEKNTIYLMLDAFVGKRKLKSALQNVLQETE